MVIMYIDDYSPLFLSLKVAGIATIIVFASGVIFARLFTKKEFFGKSIIEALFTLPLVLPPTVVGFGLLVLFGKNGIIGKYLLEWFNVQVVFTWVGAVIAATVVSFPLMYRSAVGAFETVDERLESVALTMGASSWRVFWTITFPLAWPGLLSGVILSFTRALGEFGATLMIAGYIPGKTETIPMTIYFSVETGHMEKAIFWVILIVGLGFSTILWLNWWSKKNINRYIRENKG